MGYDLSLPNDADAGIQYRKKIKRSHGIEDIEDIDEIEMDNIRYIEQMRLAEKKKREDEVRGEADEITVGHQKRQAEEEFGAKAYQIRIQEEKNKTDEEMKQRAEALRKIRREEQGLGEPEAEKVEHELLENFGGLLSNEDFLSG